MMKFLSNAFIFLVFIISCKTKSDNLLQTLIPTTTLEAKSDNKIAQAAKKYVETPFSYDITMSYHVTTYKNGRNTKTAVYPMGDINPEIGVCTDVVIRSLRIAGCDLQELVHRDASKHFSFYPYFIWGQGKPDPNIDHRRVPMLNAFFKRHAKTLTIATDDKHINEWQAGDIIIWDLTGSGKMDHIGIVSDTRTKAGNIPLIIHNYPSPGYVTQENVLNRWVIKAHYRYDGCN